MSRKATITPHELKEIKELPFTKTPVPTVSDPRLHDFITVPSVRGPGLTGMRTRRAKGSKSKRKNGKTKTMTAVPKLPPQLEVSPVYYCVLRWQCVSSSTTAVTLSRIAAALGSVRIAANSVAPVVSAFRVKKLVLWPPYNAPGAATDQHVITWNTTNSGFDRDTLRVQTIPGGITTTTPLVSVPPSGSLSTFWQDSGQSGTMFSVIAQQGAVLDMHVDFNLSTGTAQFASVSTTASGSPGVLYYLGLDGTTAAWLTIGRPSLT